MSVRSRLPAASGSHAAPAARSVRAAEGQQSALPQQLHKPRLIAELGGDGDAPVLHELRTCARYAYQASGAKLARPLAHESLEAQHATKLR